MEEKEGNRLKERWFEITCRKKDSPEFAELAGDANQSPELLRFALSSLQSTTLALTKLLGDLIRSRQLPAVREMKNGKKTGNPMEGVDADVVAGNPHAIAFVAHEHTSLVQAPTASPASFNRSLTARPGRNEREGEKRAVLFWPRSYSEK